MTSNMKGKYFSYALFVKNLQFWNFLSSQKLCWNHPPHPIESLFLNFYVLSQNKRSEVIKNDPGWVPLDLTLTSNVFLYWTSQHPPPPLFPPSLTISNVKKNLGIFSWMYCSNIKFSFITFDLWKNSVVITPPPPPISYVVWSKNKWSEEELQFWFSTANRIPLPLWDQLDVKPC